MLDFEAVGRPLIPVAGRRVVEQVVGSDLEGDVREHGALAVEHLVVTAGGLVHLHLLQRRDDLGLEQYAAGLDDGGRPRRTTLIVS